MNDQKNGFDIGFNLEVSEDKTEAVIFTKPGGFTGRTMDDVKQFLESHWITYGITDDSTIARYLRKKQDPNTPLKIAVGTSPTAGTPSKIQYRFDTDPLKVGTITESGDIDYKDRGEIPQVKAGEVIAEKIPAKEGTPGVNVFGQSIPPPAPEDNPIVCGSGAKLAEGGLKVVATTDGRPELAADGTLYVFEDLPIAGDIGIHTGHVDFDGRIEGEGAINDGYRVKGRSLLAQEILKADVDVVGDITVLGGIIGGRVKSGGNIRAKYVQGATLHAAGDIVVENNISDSELRANGTCIADRGKILSSTIDARQGITAAQIGSEKSTPCELLVGLDDSLEQEIEVFKNEILEYEENIEALESEISNLNDNILEFDSELPVLADRINHARGQQTALRQKIEEPAEAISKSKIEQAVKAFQFLGSKIIEIRDKEVKLLDRKKAAEEKIKEKKIKIGDAKNEIKKLNEQLSELNKLSVIKEGVFARCPVVKVSGTIYSLASIKGPHSSHILYENYNRIQIREMKKSATEVLIRWELMPTRY